MQYCSAERNEGTADIERWARANGKDGYRETVRRFNCSGTDAVEHPQVNLRPRHFVHMPPPLPRQLTNPPWLWLPDAVAAEREAKGTCE